MIPVATVIGLTYGSLLEGAVLTETYFCLARAGTVYDPRPFLLDFNAVMGALLDCSDFSLANLVVDILYAFLNPKIRFG